MSSQRTVDSYLLRIKRSIVSGLMLVPLVTGGAWLMKVSQGSGATADSCPVLRIELDPLAAGVVIRACGQIVVAGQPLALRYNFVVELTGDRLPLLLRRPPR